MRPSVFVVHPITRKLFTAPDILESMVTHQQRYPEYNRSSANLLPKRCPRDADHVLGRISHEVRILTIPVSIPAGSHTILGDADTKEQLIFGNRARTSWSY